MRRERLVIVGGAAGGGGSAVSTASSVSERAASSPAAAAPRSSRSAPSSRTRDLSRPRSSDFFQHFEDSRPAFEDVAYYFRGLGLDVYSHEQLYTTRRASRYFADVLDRYLDSSIIFFDPDSGFEPAGGAKDAHRRLT